jgi:hypothetical protein
MKKLWTLVALGCLSGGLLTGCFGLSIGGGGKSTVQNPTVGQELIDLQIARESGALTETEFEAQKLKILGRR